MLFRESAIFTEKSKWISYQQEAPREGRMRAISMFAKGFELSQLPVKATLEATALGVYRAFLNGSATTDAQLLPGYTEYHDRLQVHATDVTELLRTGSNDVWLELSDGWYRGQVGLLRDTDQWGDRTAVRALLSLEFADGTVRQIPTDETWRHRHSSHQADMLEGELVDFNLDVPGALEPASGVAHWQTAVLLPETGAEFIAEVAPPVRVTQSLAPVSITAVSDGTIVDFGQNLAGWIRLCNLGPAGTKLTIYHGEALDAEGRVNQENFTPRNIPFIKHEVFPGQTDQVVSAGIEGQVFEPAHSTKGFRFVFIEGLTVPLEPNQISAQVVHTDLAKVGEFSCSNEDLNWLHNATDWSFRGNAIDIPTDCPTRERAGWSADWEIFFNSAAFLYDVDGFTRKWLKDLTLKQWANGIIGNMAPCPKGEGEGGATAFTNGSAGWGDGIVIIPWKHYNAYGDLDILRETWPNMVRWMDWVTDQAATKRHDSRVEANAQPLPHEQYLWDAGFHFGEWFEPIVGEFDFGAAMRADKGIIATAYFAHSTALMTRIAMLLGDVDSANKYTDLSLKVRAAWNTEYVDKAGRLTVPTQANCVRALHFNLIAPQHRKSVEDQLVELVHAANDHLGTGFLATPYLLPAITETGNPELAFKVFTQRDWPSWLLMKDQGATTVWERWEGYDANGNPVESHNHYSKGAVISFLHNYVAGIRPFEGSTLAKRVLIKPQPMGDLTWAKASHQTAAGKLSTSWKLTSGRFELELEIPSGCNAEVVLPNGERFKATSGNHQFTCGL
jgi:alpha-L-rhamnosidase